MTTEEGYKTYIGDEDKHILDGKVFYQQRHALLFLFFFALIKLKAKTLSNVCVSRYACVGNIFFLFHNNCLECRY